MIATALDRHLLRRGAMLAAAVTAAMVVTFIGVDLVASAGALLRGKADAGSGAGSTTGLLAQLYLNRIPLLLGVAIPVATVVAALAVCGPMLRRGEFVALEAGGVRLRRAVRPLLALALVAGLVDAAIADLVAPHAQARALAIEDQLQGQKKVGRTWREPSTGASWFADRALLVGTGQPMLRGVVVAAPRELVIAEQVVWDGRRWSARGQVAVMRSDLGGGNTLERRESLALDGPLALPPPPEELFRRLLPRYTMTGPELAARGEPADVALLASRWSRVVMPLLCLACALPVFVRFANAHQIAVGAVRGAAMALIPAAILIIGGMVADTAPGPAWAAILVATALAAVPGWWLWLRWRL